MRITIRNLSSIRTEVFRKQIEQHLNFALDRFGHKIREIQISLLDQNAHKGGIDTRCILRIRLLPKGLLVVKAISDDPLHAVQAVAEKAKRVIVQGGKRSRLRKAGGAEWTERNASLPHTFYVPTTPYER